MKYLPSLVAATAAILMAACTNDECLENRNSLPLAGFYNAADKNVMSMGGLCVYGIDAPGDSLLSDGSAMLSKTYLPFSLNAPATTYVFRHLSDLPIDEQLSDTVTFNYIAEPFFVSVACGVSYRFEMTEIEYTRHAIDSIACPDGIITNTPIENIQIFFKTDEQGGDDQ